MDRDTLQTLSKRLIEFRDARDWGQYHTPKNLILAINGEAGQLASLVQWASDWDAKNNIHISIEAIREMADIFIYLVNLANLLEIDLIEAANLRVDDNEIRYPIEKCKGKSTRASDL